MEGEFTFQVLTNLDQISALRPIWESWQWHPNTEYNAFLHYLRFHQENACPYVIVVHFRGEPLALVVGRIESIQLRLCGMFRVGVRTLTIFTGGILGKVPEEAVCGLIATLKETIQRGIAERVTFHNVRKDIGLVQQILANSKGSLLASPIEWNQHWRLTIPKTSEELLASLSPSHRHFLRRMQRRLLKEFSKRVLFRCVRNAEEVEVISQHMEQVARKTYHRGMGAGYRDSEELRQRLRLAASSGKWRAFLAYIDESPEAFYVGSVIGDSYYGWYTAYNPGLKNYDLGQLLLVYAIGILATEGVRYFDFDLGDALYKRRLCDENWQDGSVSLYPFSPKGFLLNLGQFTAYRAKCLGKFLLQRAGIFGVVKRLWRQGLEKKAAQSVTSNHVWKQF
jgi:hypothetical protein